MTAIFRLSTVNGLLLALYFIPVWTSVALKIVIFPIQGLYDRANIGPAIFFTDTFHLFALGTVRFAWLLAMVKLLVVAFFAVFALAVARASVRWRGDGDEALAIALGIGTVLSYASMLIAAHVGEGAAEHLHATETLLLIGGLMVLAADARQPVATREAVAATQGIWRKQPSA
jgi:hypothetical protein